MNVYMESPMGDVCRAHRNGTASLRGALMSEAMTVPSALCQSDCEVRGEPVKDFAQSAGISTSNAGVRVFRAREALRKQVLKACGTCATHAAS